MRVSKASLQTLALLLATLVAYPWESALAALDSEDSGLNAPSSHSPHALRRPRPKAHWATTDSSSLLVRGDLDDSDDDGQGTSFCSPACGTLSGDPGWFPPCSTALLGMGPGASAARGISWPFPHLRC